MARGECRLGLGVARRLQRVDRLVGRVRSGIANAGRRVLADRNQAAEVAILLLDQLVEKRGAKLGQCALRIPTPQTAGRRRILQN